MEATHIHKCDYLEKLINDGKHPTIEEDNISNCPYANKLIKKIKYPHMEHIDHIDHSLACPYIQELNRQKRETQMIESKFTKTIFAYLFPGSPKVNSLLATFYISSVPNFILFFVPPDIRPSSLNSLVGFAVGGLLGDVFLHLLPQSFLGESNDDKVHFVQVEEKKNVVIGLAIFIGLTTFFVIDKMMRVASGGEDGGHSHSHSHTEMHSSSATTTSLLPPNKDSKTLRQRKSEESKKVSDNQEKDDNKEHKKAPSTSIKLSAYLNLIADATHNFTDGLAMAASFYTSPSIGATTTVAVFFHEIPHEIGDYAILIQSGFTKRYALLSQFVTALGAFLGTFAGIAIEEFSRGEDSGSGTDGYHGKNTSGIMGTGAHLSDLVIPFTAGGFLYIATVGVIPELLEVTGKLSKDLKQAGIEFLAMFIGVGMMAIIAWNEA
ncbi:13514_t:CDS:1 [Ambispora gerdemannii]|uniref:13514_t:CDS:1 n=1 Tax=Ambispora gerdemannii TaxID=144530 RepID=A0A9N8V697_9GLOM|nr:13514_t:CDS:1 [Ambispora gerdemannii]